MSKKICVILSNISVAAVSRARFIVSTAEEFNKSSDEFYEIGIIAIDPVSGHSIPVSDKVLSLYQKEAISIADHNVDVIALDIVSYAFTRINFSVEKRICVWCSCDEHSSIISDLNASLIFGLIEASGDKVYSVDKEDVIKWKFKKIHVQDFILSGSGLFDASISFDPLIEKGIKNRVLIDSIEFRSIYYLKESFISLEKHDCEVWCVARTKLYDWMKPDMLFEEIFRGEEGIHYSSVDAVILDIFDSASQAKAFDLYSRGILPIPVEINEYSVELSQVLSNKFIYLEGDLEFRINKTITDINSNSSYKLEMQNISRDKIKTSKHRSKIINMISNKNDIDRVISHDSALLKAINLSLRQNDINLKISVDLPRRPADLIQFTGWSLSTTNNICDLVLIMNKKITHPIVERVHRPDVNEIYNVESSAEVGFLLSCLHIDSHENNPKSTFSLLAIDAERSVGSYIQSLKTDGSFIIQETEIKILDKKDTLVSLQQEEVAGYIEHETTIRGYIFKIDPQIISFDKVIFNTNSGTTEPIRFVMAVEKYEQLEMHESEFVMLSNNELGLPDFLSTYLNDAVIAYIWVRNDNVRCKIVD